MDPILRGHARKGLAAILKAHRNLFKVGEFSPEESLDIDSAHLDPAFNHAFHNDNRWDYYVCLRKKRQLRIYYLEVHRADDTEVDLILRKSRWLRGRIGASALPDEDNGRPVFWIPAGPIHLTP